MTGAVYCPYEIWRGHPVLHITARRLRAEGCAHSFFNGARAITFECDAATAAGCPTCVQDQYSTSESYSDVGEATHCDGGHFFDRESG